MNKGGLANKGGELMKEMEELLVQIAPLRKTQGDCKYRYEEVSASLEDLTNFLYHQITINPDFDWKNPEPILNTEGTPLPEYEANFRSMLINSTIQQNEQYKDAKLERDAAKLAYYNAETEVVTLMERIGAKKASMGLVTGLARLATDES